MMVVAGVELAPLMGKHAEACYVARRGHGFFPRPRRAATPHAVGILLSPL